MASCPILSHIKTGFVRMNVRMMCVRSYFHRFAFYRFDAFYLFWNSRIPHAIESVVRCCQWSREDAHVLYLNYILFAFSEQRDCKWNYLVLQARKHTQTVYIGPDRGLFNFLLYTYYISYFTSSIILRFNFFVHPFVCFSYLFEFILFIFTSKNRWLVFSSRNLFNQNSK